MMPLVTSFEDFYADTHRRVRASLVVVVGDKDLAFDAVDEAYARALLAWDRVGAMDAPRAWVFKVALNVVRRRVRRRAMEQALLRRVAADPVLPAAAGEVWLVVRDLPERQRAAVVLRYLGDLTEAQIAEVMGIKRGTVSRTLADAHRSLAVVLGDERDTRSDLTMEGR
jgi:RNA polymerase sigma-70 factor (ECF subfamily)